MEKDEYTIIGERFTPEGIKIWDLAIPNGPYSLSEVSSLMSALKSETTRIIAWSQYEEMRDKRRKNA